MKFLCHAGPWSANYLSSIVQYMDHSNESVILSGHKKYDKSGMCNEYYSFLKKNKSEIFFLSDVDFSIIKRCRLLRELPLDSAILHLNSMRHAIRNVFDNERPDIVLSETIDSYIMDILQIEAEARKIPFIGLVNVFLNGYFRISARGEYNYVREPDINEVEQVLNQLEKKDYLPNFLLHDIKKPMLSVFNKWIRNLSKIPYFSIKRIITSEYYNYHYWASVKVSCKSFNFFPKFEIGDYGWQKEILCHGKTVIYVPLQMVPEATVDYWCESLDVIEYDKVLLSFIEKHQDFHFLIKEHPYVIGYRKNSFYKKLQSMNNVTICPTQINSNYLFDYYSAVLVWTGTVGFESKLRGKPILCFTKPYYFKNNDSFKLVNNKTATDEILDFIFSGQEVVTQEKKINMVSFLLSGVDKGDLIVDGTWKDDDENDFKKMTEVANSLKKYLSNRVLND